MLRKKYKIIKDICFERVEYSEGMTDNTVCEDYECKFCGPDFDNRYCENIEIKKDSRVYSLQSLCMRTTGGINEPSEESHYSYIPERECYELDAIYKIKKKKR